MFGGLTGKIVCKQKIQDIQKQYMVKLKNVENDWDNDTFCKTDNSFGKDENA